MAIYEKAIADFEALYPNIHVNLRLYTDYGRIYNDVITNIATDTTPNVCITYPDHIATYLTGANVVAPLDELFADEKYGLGGSELRYDGPTREEMIPQFLDECAFAGHHYAIPYMRSTEACYVNKTFVEALGYELPEVLTWDCSPARLLCPWNFSGKNIGVGCHSFLQGIFLTQGIELGSPTLNVDSLPSEPSGKTTITSTKWTIFPNLKNTTSYLNYLLLHCCCC